MLPSRPVVFVVPALISLFALGCFGPQPPAQDPPCDSDPDCAEEEYLCEDGECPDGDFATLPADDVEARAATLEADLFEMPPVEPTDHGFCLGRNSEPSADDDNSRCASLGKLEQAGIFRHRVEDLDPGSTYRVRAFIAFGDSLEYADDEPVEFTTDAPAVGDIEVRSTADGYEIEWEGLDDVTGYRIHRDDEFIDEVGPDRTNYVDDDVRRIDPLPAPKGLEASNGEHGEFVRISWDPPDLDGAEASTYQVIAVYPDTESAPNESGVGDDIPGLLGYELEVDNDGWIGAGMVDSYDHTEAPAGTIAPGEPSVSHGEYPDRVELQLPDLDTSPGEPVEYRVRAMSSSGSGELSESVTGHRGIGDIDIQWQRSLSDSGETFSNIPGATGENHDDYDAPDDGSIRYYRAVVDANGAAPRTTEPVAGSTSAAPEVQTHDITEITARSVTIEGVLVDTGSPQTESHGICVDTSASPTVDSSNCTDLGTGSLPRMFTATVDELEPTTEYYARTYASNDAGVSYGDTKTFTTIPDAPTEVTATQGESPDAITLHWQPGQGDVDEYEIHRNGEYLTTIDTTTWNDEDVVEATINFDELYVSQGGSTEHVALGVSDYVHSGDEMLYQVYGIHDQTVGEPSQPALGYTGFGEVSLQWQRSESDEGDAFEDLPEATEESYRDEDAPEADSIRYYRLVIDTGEETTTSEPKPGFRARTLYGYTASDDTTVHKITNEGETIWEFDGHDDHVRAVAVDPDGYVYSASVDETIRKIDDDGEQIWSVDAPGTTLNDVAVDNDGYVYSASADGMLGIIDDDGEIIWSFENSNGILGVAVDSDGYVYLADAGPSTRKIDPDAADGEEVIWTFSDGFWRMEFVSIDSSGDVYTGQSGVSHREIWQLDEAGEAVWGYEPSSRPAGLAVGPDDELFVTLTDRVISLDDNGDKRWGFELSDEANGIAVDPYAMLYVAKDSDRLVKYDTDGRVIFDYDGHENSVNDIAFEPGVHGLFSDRWNNDE